MHNAARSVTLQQLHDFVTVATYGSLRAAARQHGVTQSGLTKSLDRLESDCGVTLIHRSPQGVELSDAGRQLYAAAQTILREVERIRCALNSKPRSDERKPSAFAP